MQLKLWALNLSTGSTCSFFSPQFIACRFCFCIGKLQTLSRILSFYRRDGFPHHPVPPPGDERTGARWWKSSQVCFSFKRQCLCCTGSNGWMDLFWQGGVGWEEGVELRKCTTPLHPMGLRYCYKNTKVNTVASLCGRWTAAGRAFQLLTVFGTFCTASARFPSTTSIFSSSSSSSLLLPKGGVKMWNQNVQWAPPASALPRSSLRPFSSDFSPILLRRVHLCSSSFEGMQYCRPSA